MDKKFCDNCGQEIFNKWYELSGTEKEMDWGMKIARGKIETCSLRCMEEWINRRRRHVTKITTESTEGLATRYHNAEIGDINIEECVQEKDAFSDPYLVVRPEIWCTRIAKK